MLPRRGHAGQDHRVAQRTRGHARPASPPHARGLPRLRRPPRGGARHQGHGGPRRAFDRLCRSFAATRPTAVNLFWAIERMRRVFVRNRTRSPDTLRTLLEREALAIHDEDVAANRRLGAHGAALVEDGATVLTHCNAGALATAGYGTALGIVRAA